MNSFDIRKKFLEFFKKNGHVFVPSSSLIPLDDPTLLFVNAGMNQFKDMFLGKEKRAYKCATSSQKCVRAGGKHNDLDEVGFTNRHLTFFEMLGNFSFGDYFKKEAIEFAWQFLTKEIKIAPERMVVSVFETDDESYDLWKRIIGIPIERIYRLGEKENFWQMGDVGPCGPCSEIHIDYGKNVGCKSKGCDPSCPCGRFVEIWNLVFMQYDKQLDGTLKNLQQKGVDTGMGLERLAMILQDKDSVFATDLFLFLHEKIEQLTDVKYAKSSKDIQTAFHVLSDHVRSVSLLIADGCSPSNDGRGYVLRKIIRRAALFSQKITDDNSLLPKLAETFCNVMEVVFSELKKNKKLIIDIVKNEVERFTQNLESGQLIFAKFIAANKKAKKKSISGEQAFKLYDTYGFPVELTRVLATENGFTVDMDGFKKEMEKQRAQSGKKVASVKSEQLDISTNIKSEFIGYEDLETISPIVWFERHDDTVWLITKETPFYVESGGQASDTGWVTIDRKTYPVLELQKIGDVVAVKIEYERELKLGTEVHAVVDFFSRENTAKNHTATHLLQKALMQVVGDSVKQAGSFVNADYLRFDFSCANALTEEQIKKVEQIVNQKIQENLEVTTVHTTLKQAKNAGVTAFFGEKYNPEKVRVVEVKGFSAELCGGTHVKRTGQIGSCKITSETALATGTRRIEAVTGFQAVKLFQRSFNTVKELGEQFKAKPEEVVDVVYKQGDNYIAALREIKQLKKKLLLSCVPKWQQEVRDVDGVPFLFLSMKNYANDELKAVCQEIEKKAPGFYFVTSQAVNENRVSFVGFVSDKFLKKVDLKALSKILKDEYGLRGGGKPGLIQGGGVDVNLDEVKVAIEKWLK